MSGVNKVILLGHLGSDPDLKYTPSGVPVAKFSLATSDEWTDKNGQKQEDTEWHKVVVWNKLAENCAKYLAKGRQVFVEGKITTVSWDDKQTGQKRYATEIRGDSVTFLGDGGGKRPQTAQQPQAPQQSRGQAQPDYIVDDIPF